MTPPPYRIMFCIILCLAEFDSFFPEIDFNVNFFLFKVCRKILIFDRIIAFSIYGLKEGSEV